jgi:hypothetical protein
LRGSFISVVTASPVDRAVAVRSYFIMVGWYAA